MLKGTGKTVRLARTLRREMSLPEVLLWRELRKRPGSLKFRRQHPVGPYVLDFFCAEARLAIEIDGDAHNLGARPTRDRLRDAWLGEHDLTVLRMPAAEVLRDLDAVVRYVVEQARSRLPLHQPAAGPPPRAGED